MLKKMIVMLLIGLVTNVAIFAGESKKEAKFTKKVKTGIAKLGTGKDAKVRVKLKTKKKIKGYITEINEDSFVVMDKKTGKTVEVSYSNVKQVRGNNLTTGVVLGIGLAVVVSIIILILAGRSD